MEVQTLVMYLIDSQKRYKVAISLKINKTNLIYLVKPLENSIPVLASLDFVLPIS